MNFSSSFISTDVLKASLIHNRSTQCRKCYEQNSTISPLDLSKEIGKKYGNRTILNFAEIDNPKGIFIEVECDCGNIDEIMLNSLINDKCTKCTECSGKTTPKKHGLSKTIEYLNWKQLKHKNILEFCKEWLIFENFIKDMGIKPENTFFNRVDRDKPYNKDNCEWKKIK